jgi:dolichyl-phosphate beta-glucosyltransferase
MGEISTLPCISLVVPVFNETGRLAAAVPDLLAFIDTWPDGSELIFVDDGSTDATLRELDLLAGSHPRTRVITRPHEGKGAAVAAGIEDAQASIVAFTDVDLATPLDEITRLITLASTKWSLVIGSRALVGSRIEVHEVMGREILGRLYNRLVRMNLTPGIYDTQCGAKAAPMAIWSVILPYCREKGFAWDVEIVAAALALRMEVDEVGVRWSHDKRTKVNVLVDGMRMLVALTGIYRRVRAIRNSLPARSLKENSLPILVDEGPVVEKP